MKFSRSLGAAVVALGLLATSCGGGSAESAETAATNSAPAATTAPAQPTAEPVADSLVLPTVGGGQIDFGSLQGQDVVLWFWAPW